MATLANARASQAGLLGLLVRELAPTEGRMQAVLRIAASCSFCVAAAMVFQIPLAAYSAYIVFLNSKEENTATVTTGIGALLAVTLAVVLAIGLAMIDTAEPALRLPAMALATFAAMWSTRTFALGPVTFLAGFVLVMLQSLVDAIPSPEALTHIALWLWVVVLLPVATTLVLNLFFGPTTRVYVLRTMRRLLAELETGLEAGYSAKDLARWRETAVAILGKAHGAEAVATERLLETFTMMEVLPQPLEPEVRKTLAEIARLCRTWAGVSEPLPSAAPGGDPAVQAVHRSLTDLYQSLASATPPTPGQPPAHKVLLAPDAFTNAAHWQFAFKTTLAVMIVYTTYTLLDWPGLRTSIVTCFFVALGSLGETIHKLTLRISGAIIGGTLAGVCIVWVLPHMTDIGQLCASIAVVSAGAGWIATGSERISYAGMQIAFAFFLGILQDYAPATDLTVLRDRVVGILLGNVVMTLVFTLLWPESARSRFMAAVRETLRAVGILLESPGRARMQVVQSLVKAQHYAEIGEFELHLLPGHLRNSDDELRRLSGAALVSTSPVFIDTPDKARIEQLRLEIQHVAATTT